MPYASNALDGVRIYFEDEGGNAAGPQVRVQRSSSPPNSVLEPLIRKTSCGEPEVRSVMPIIRILGVT
jgi:hypothetical protein